MNQHEPTPNYKAKNWLLYCLHKGYSQREMAEIVGVSAFTIRLWLKKHGIKWRTNSESLLAQSDKVSERAKEVWSDEERRKRQSEKMKEVQSKRKTELSKSAKENWKNNRDNIINGIRKIKKDDTYRENLDKKKPQYKIYNGEYIDECVKKYGDDFDYSQTNITNWKTKILIKCNTCGNTLLKWPDRHLQWGACEYCGTTKGEKTLQKMLSEHSIQYIIDDRKTIPPLELDIFIPEYNLAIEHHGLYWHSYNYIESKTDRLRHQRKQQICNSKHINLLQFFDFELQNKTNIKTYARSLNIINLTNAQAELFFNKNHLQGHRPASTILALYDNNNDIKMAASFSKSIGGYELIRMATKINTSVIGGASKLIKEFIHRQKPNIFFTYADLRYSTGQGYLTIGFELFKITKPNYFYYKGNQILSRQKCQKHKLHKLLNNFDPTITEAENMFNNGYRRVWDAGHMKLIFKS